MSSWLLSNCLRILFCNVSQWEQVNLSTGLIHQTVKPALLCQHKMHCQCANHFPNATASLQAGHQHSLLQRHCLNLRCVQKTNWWRGKSSCATSWEMRGNQWIMKGPLIRVVAVLCGNAGQRKIKTSSYFQKCVYSKLKKIGEIKSYQHRPQIAWNVFFASLIEFTKVACGCVKPIIPKKIHATPPPTSRATPPSHIPFTHHQQQHPNSHPARNTPSHLPAQHLPPKSAIEHNQQHPTQHRPRHLPAMPAIKHHQQHPKKL